MSNDQPPVEDRRAMYAAWRSRLDQRVARNRELLDDDDDRLPPLADDWSPERLYEESRRLAEADRAS